MKLLGRAIKVPARAELGEDWVVLVRLACRLLRMLLGGLGVEHGQSALRVVLLDQGVEIVGAKPELIQVLLLGDVQRVLAVAELENRPVHVAHGVVVMHGDPLEVLDQAALQIAGAGRLHGRVDQTLAARHAVKVILLGADPGQEAACYIPAGARARLERGKRRKRLPADHRRHAPALEFLLAQHAGDLRHVHSRAFGARDGHHLHVVGGEFFEKSVRQALVDHSRSQPVHLGLHRGIHAGHLLVRPKNLLQAPLELRVRHGIVVCVGQPHVLQGRRATVVFAGVKQVVPPLVTVRRQPQVVHAAREANHLYILGKQSSENAEQLPRGGGSVELVAGVDETVSFRPKLALVQHSRKEFAVLEDDRRLLHTLLAPVLARDLCFRDQVELRPTEGEVPEQGRDNLFARPQLSRLEDRGRQRHHSPSTRAVLVRAQRTIQDLV
ncbi:MAG: hypothetical protein BJ554DRAFT_6630, partial [Olpidium bornovanus]